MNNADMLHFAATALEGLAEGLETEMRQGRLHPLEEEGVTLACKIARQEALRMRDRAKELEE